MKSYAIIDIRTGNVMDTVTAGSITEAVDIFTDTKPEYTEDDIDVLEA